MSADLPKVYPVGSNIRRLRKIKGLSQQELADKLEISRQGVGLLEQAQTLDEDKLKKVAEALGVTVEAVETLSEEQAIFQINTMNDNAQAIFQYNANPIEKIIELSERLLQAEKEKYKLLQEMLEVKSEQIEMLKDQLKK
nr:helix-turn-helix transcriptional regulator [Pedobacter sp. ASV19]